MAWRGLRRRHGAGDWSPRGYFMQQVACETAVPVSAATDSGFLSPLWTELLDSGLAFDDGRDASLVIGRSEGVRRRKGGFWQAEKGTLDRKERNLRRVEIVLGAAVLTAFLLLGGRALFTLRSVNVVGNTYFSADTVKRSAGVLEGMSFLSLNDREIAANLAQTTSLALVSVNRHFPNSVTITVHERKAEMYLIHCGIIYTLDNRGMVLQSVSDLTLQPYMVRVEGMGVRSCAPGKEITLDNSSKLDLVHAFLVEIKAMGLTDQVQELYVDDITNLTLQTRDGYSVRLGDASQLHEKLRAMQLTCEYLLADARQGGTVDVSIPERPTWIPGVGL